VGFERASAARHAHRSARAPLSALTRPPALTTAAASRLPLPSGAAARFYSLVAFNPSIASHSGAFLSSRWCWQLDALVSGLLGVAFYGVGASVYDAYQRHRHMTHHWALGLVTALATNDERIFRVFALFGGVAACKAAVEAVERLAKQLLTSWGTMILEVRRG